MEQILIPSKRAKLLKEDKSLLKSLEDMLSCKLSLHDNVITAEGEPINEYSAKEVITAFGRGFGINQVRKLLSDDYFFSSINLKEALGKENRIRRIKARIIGTKGRTKEYISDVSGASISVFGNTVSFIGTIDEIKIAEAGVRVLIEGGTHKRAYRVIEAMRRRMKEGTLLGV